MSRKRGLVVLLVMIMSLYGSPAHPQEDSEGKYALGLKAGTLGAGIEGIVHINPKLNARLGINAFEYDYSGTESDIKYDFELNLFSVAALVDWFPFDSGFRFTGGLLVNQNNVDMKAETTASYTIGNTTYTSAQIGTLSGDVDFNEVSPYFGIGWGNPFGKDKRWTFVVDIGLVYQGSPNVDLDINGPLANNAAFLANLAREEDNLEGEIDDYDVYPVISVGVTYRF